MRTTRLALLVEACAATGFPSLGEGPLCAALCAEFAARGPRLNIQEAADSGLRMALAGVTSTAVFDAVSATAAAAAEGRHRWRPKWLLWAVARLALCGVIVPALCAVCSKSLGAEARGVGREARAAKEMAEGSFRVFSELPLVSLHMKGRQVPKMANAPSGTCEVPATAEQWAGPGGFEDPRRPLVVDLGCGRGAWLLQMLAEDGSGAATGWNGLGIDTSPRLLNYPRGLAARWGLAGRLRFALSGAEEALQRLVSYPGPVVLVALHFPTPYAAKGSPDKRNAQLPSLEDFIVRAGTEPALARLGGSSALPRTPLVFVQSATDDVALTVRRQLEASGALTAICGAELSAHAAVRARLPTAAGSTGQAARAQPAAVCGELGQGEWRPQRVAAEGGAEDGGWLSSSPFPPTETEVELLANGRHVWRFALAPAVVAA